ncbi:CLUMA_CG001260, isoform A [Clunio marinus]|uniref:CLUMA_CG001260, isoform A n=1 Tax=Clunio marinus TaxID=568069 RepID=A0A1J1HHT9_9DIPT|nr:CLUMA_CG001260, isoform A [Clunio marinus]
MTFFKALYRFRNKNSLREDMPLLHHYFFPHKKTFALLQAIKDEEKYFYDLQGTQIVALNFTVTIMFLFQYLIFFIRLFKCDQESLFEKERTQKIFPQT